MFTPPNTKVPLDNHFVWWRYVAGANWRHPNGPDSDLKGKEKHPVVRIAFEDAAAYAKWAGKRLPTEAEFEFAARGGLDRKRFVWGDEFKPGGKFQANSYQGHFPDKNTAEDGFTGSAPVGRFAPNGFRLFDMAGNVWEWTADWYRPDYYRTLAATKQVARNPQGPADSFDPSEPSVAKRVHKGGSFLYGRVLRSLHAWRSWQRRAQHRHEPSWVSLRAVSEVTISFYSRGEQREIH